MITAITQENVEEIGRAYRELISSLRALWGDVRPGPKLQDQISWQVVTTELMSRFYHSNHRRERRTRRRSEIVDSRACASSPGLPIPTSRCRDSDSGPVLATVGGGDLIRRGAWNDRQRRPVPSQTAHHRAGPHRVHGRVPAALSVVVGRPGELLGKASRADHLVPPLERGLRPRLRQRRLRLVSRWAAECLLQLRRPPSQLEGRPGRHHLGQGRARRVRAHHLSPAQARGLPGGQRAAVFWRSPRRPGLHLHAHDPRAGLHHARLRPDRCRPLHRLRWLQLRGHPGPDPGRRRPGGGDGQRRTPRAADPAPQGDRGPGCGRPRSGGDRAGGPTYRHRRAHETRPRSLAGRGVPPPALHLHLRVDGLGGSSVHPLHFGFHRQAQGGASHHRRLHGLRGHDPRAGLRLPPRRHLLLRRRHRLDHRPQLHHLRTARQRRDHCHVRVRSQLSRCRPLLAGGGRSRGQHLLHRADRDPRHQQPPATAS